MRNYFYLSIQNIQSLFPVSSHEKIKEFTILILVVSYAELKEDLSASGKISRSIIREKDRYVTRDAISSALYCKQ
jgi:hypothetical protein